MEQLNESQREAVVHLQGPLIVVAGAGDLMNLIREELGLSERERRFPRKDTLAAVYSRTVNAGRRLAEVVEADFPWCRDEVDGIRSVFRRYARRKREHNVLDYDDL